MERHEPTTPSRAEAVTLAAMETSPSADAESARRARRACAYSAYARWVAWRIITWPPDNCLHSRRPIVFGAKWVELVNDDDRCRFHAECLPAWRLQQETAACRALGLKLEPALTERTP